MGVGVFCGKPTNDFEGIALDRGAPDGTPSLPTVMGLVKQRKHEERGKYASPVSLDLHAACARG